MVENEVPTEAPDRISGADALFVLRQFTGLLPDAYITVTVSDKRKRTIFCHHLPLNNLDAEWNEWVITALTSYNERGLRIEYNVNPTLAPRRSAMSCLTTLVAYFEIQKTSLADRLRQMAILHKARFEPSYVVQWPGGLCGVYVLDQQLKVEKHKSLSRSLAHLIDSASVKMSDHPFFSLPLPGFRCDGKVVKLLHPAKPTHVSVRLYSAGEFAQFPEVTMENVERFYREAKDLGDEKALEFVASLLREAREKGDQRAAFVGMVVNRRKSEQQHWKELAEEFVEPHKTVIPHFKAIPIIYWNDYWTYVQRGSSTKLDVLARLVMRVLHRSLDVNIDMALACQGLDIRLIREMIFCGYTCGAVVDFFFRPGHNISVGKDAAYIMQLYVHEVTLIRTAAKEMAEQETRTSPHCLEFIGAVCKAIDKIGDMKKLRGSACVDGDCLNLNVKKTHAKLYVPEMTTAKKIPLSLKQIKFIFQGCHDHYWLGKLEHTERYQWRFSIPQLQRHKLLKIFTLLTKSESAVETPPTKEVAKPE